MSETCPTCKGRGFLVMYVSEWAEAAERFMAFAHRIWNIIAGRKP